MDQMVARCGQTSFSVCLLKLLRCSRHVFISAERRCCADAMCIRQWFPRSVYSTGCDYVGWCSLRETFFQQEIIMKSFELLPGIVSLPTKASSSGNWQDSHLVRWQGNKFSPMMGWSKLSLTAFLTPPRTSHRWVDNYGVRHTAVLCQGHLYVDSGVGFVDRSPAVPMSQPTLEVGGFGDSTYNAGTYGTPRPAVQRSSDLNEVYSIDNWGQDLVFMNSIDGKLMRWSPAAVGSPHPISVPITAAPLGRMFVVTPERRVVIFASQQTLNEYAWCEQEDIDNWNFASTLSTAGFLPVEPAAPFVAARNVGNGVLIFTDVRPYLISYKGVPYIYGHDQMTECPPPLSAGLLCETPVGAVWMAKESFWNASGLSVSPVPCPVSGWITNNMSVPDTRVMGTSIHITAKSEVWFFFSSGKSKFNDRYVLWNYKEAWWSTGYMGRLCGVGSELMQNPVMFSDKYAYQHDVGYTYEGAEEPWALSHSINIDEGSVLSTFDTMLLDMEGNTNALALSVEYNVNRLGATYNTGNKFVMSNGFVPFRATGRDFRVKAKSNNPSINGAWALGKCLINLIPRGGR